MEAEAAGGRRAAMLELVEAGGDAGDVEGAVGIKGPVALVDSEPVEADAEQAVMQLAGPISQPTQLPSLQRRDLGAVAELVASYVRQTEADQLLDCPPGVTARGGRCAESQ